MTVRLTSQGLEVAQGILDAVEAAIRADGAPSSVRAALISRDLSWVVSEALRQLARSKGLVATSIQVRLAECVGEECEHA